MTISQHITRNSLKALFHFSKIESSNFYNGLKNVETVQKKILKSLIDLGEKTEFGKSFDFSSIRNYDSFSRRIPVSKYDDLSEQILKQKNGTPLVLSGETCNRYQPTSGSTSKIKWIPYTGRFLSELDRAVSPMLVDAFKNTPGVMNGKHYWALSWIPTDLRKEISKDVNNDMNLLPWWKRFFMHATMAVPDAVAWTDNSENSLIATLAYLASTENLSFLSIWSPTFAINLFDKFSQYRVELSEILKYGHWMKWQDSLSYLPAPISKKTSDLFSTWDGTINESFLKRLWPKMAMISSWDTSTSKLWADKLKALFPSATFLGKGLWATEGVVTIPFQGKYPLTVTSHFYEFQDIDTGKIFPAWKLKTGQLVKPLLTTGSGFFRYEINDKLLVREFLYDCPCFEFLGRDREVDMTGEKISPEIAWKIVSETSRKFDINVITLAAEAGFSKQSIKPGYYLLCETPKNHKGSGCNDLKKNITEYAESMLKESFHYNLARELCQLDKLSVITTSDCRKKYQMINESRGMILGNMKIEPLILLNSTELDILTQ